MNDEKNDHIRILPYFRCLMNDILKHDDFRLIKVTLMHVFENFMNEFSINQLIDQTLLVNCYMAQYLIIDFAAHHFLIF